MKQAIYGSLVLTWEMEWCSLDITCRSSHQRHLVKIDVLGNFAKFKEKHFIEKRESGTGVFCKFCEISNNTFSTEHIWVPASEHS